MWVVKLGGSLLSHPMLAQCLDWLAQQNDVVIVPGGGVYAERVRQAQLVSGWDDVTAHWLAIAAMNQYAQYLHTLQPNLPMLESLEELTRAKSSVVICLPYQILREHASLPCSWQVTSDSIAAWLAHKLAAQDLLLIKSIRPAGQSASVKDLQQAGVVDEYFDQLLSSAAYATWLLRIEDVVQDSAISGLSELRQYALAVQENP